MFSLLNFFLVSGSIHTLDPAAPEVAASFSLRASNHSRVTGGRLAIFRFKLYLAHTHTQSVCSQLQCCWSCSSTFHHPGGMSVVENGMRVPFNMQAQ